MNLRRWILVALVAGSDFTRWAILAFYGGGLILAVLMGVVALAAIGGIVCRLAP